MKSHFTLLVVLSALALARDKNTKALKSTAATTNVTWNDAVLYTDLKSALFGSCISAANTRKMQYFFIEDPAQGNVFKKYEINRFEKGLKPVNWNNEIQCNDILDCSRASKDYSMFQYNGTTCRMATPTYLYNNGPFCDNHEGYKQDIVYINEAVTALGCPANTDVVVGDNGPVCIGGTHLDESFNHLIPYSSCDIHYGGHLYTGSDSVNFTTIRNYMRNKKYQGEYLTDMLYDPNSQSYKWMDLSVIDISYFAVTPPEPYLQLWLVISSSHDYLLRAINNTDPITGFLCLGDPIQ